MNRSPHGDNLCVNVCRNCYFLFKEEHLSLSLAHSQRDKGLSQHLNKPQLHLFNKPPTNNWQFPTRYKLLQYVVKNWQFAGFVS